MANLSGESPFIFEDAVPRDKFFDRREEIEFFVRNLRAKRKILLSIVAPLKYGKSSLMHRYYEILREFDDIIPIYINLRVEDRPIQLIVSVLENYGFDLGDTYRRCLESGSLRDFFIELNIKLKKKGVWLFLLFDEFHLLPELIRNEGFYRDFSDEIIFGFFRGFAEGANMSYVVCGSIIEPLMDALDIWGGRFQIIYLGPFSKNDALEMIIKLFAIGGMNISTDYAEMIAEAAGYHPFYIQYMGHQIYVEGEINRRTIRLAKQRLFEFLSPLFFAYLERVQELGEKYLGALAKLIRNEPLTMNDIVCLGKLVRIGIIRPKNAKFEFVDPLFRRYLEHIVNNLEPTEVTIVGHWAERIVGNYLLRRGYTPYYSHDSKGIFDIYTKINKRDVGIQVKYSSEGEIYLSESEAEEILSEAKNLGWIPVLAIVSKQIRFYSDIKPGKYNTQNGYQEIEDAIRNSQFF